jgi:hypothetical protein
MNGRGWFKLDALWGIDVHEAFPRDDDLDPVVRRFSKIRHYGYRDIKIEGDNDAEPSVPSDA